MQFGLPSSRSTGGFTLLELVIVVAILAITASIGVPQYAEGLRTARVGKARHELVSIAHAIDEYKDSNSGSLPLSLHQVGFGGKRDPWGVPYCYLNYADGTGDGLDWAISAGIVDPSAFVPLAGAGDGGSIGPQSAMQIAQPGAGVVSLNDAQLEAKLGRAISLTERSAIDQSVANNGTFSLFTGVPTETTRRRDRYLYPLNTDYDLFGLGPDHQTAPSLGEAVATDDVIRASNGGYFGPASNY